MACADDEFLGMIEEDAERVHQPVGVPPATHGTGTTDLKFGR